MVIPVAQFQEELRRIKVSPHIETFSAISSESFMLRPEQRGELFQSGIGLLSGSYIGHISDKVVFIAGVYSANKKELATLYRRMRGSFQIEGLIGCLDPLFYVAPHTKEIQFYSYGESLLQGLAPFCSPDIFICRTFRSTRGLEREISQEDIKQVFLQNLAPGMRDSFPEREIFVKELTGIFSSFPCYGYGFNSCRNGKNYAERAKRLYREIASPSFRATLLSKRLV